MAGIGPGEALFERLRCVLALLAEPARDLDLGRTIGGGVEEKVAGVGG